MKSKNSIVGITLGDPGGIGPEVTAKALARIQNKNLGRFLVIGNEKCLNQFSLKKSSSIELLDVPLEEGCPMGQPSIEGAHASLQYLQIAVKLLKGKKITALATAPICKETIRQIHPGFIGHTEFLAQNFSIKKFGMLFVSDKIRVIVVTRHIPLKDVVQNLTASKILDAIELTQNALKNFFHIKNPLLAVCGINPHAGEGGKLEKEEIKILIPAIKKAQSKGINAQGPFAADTLFSPKIGTQYDAVIAMYHDQGLIAAKTLCFTELVNMTVGLPFVRTSPAHGTAFNIAGKGVADPSSMIEAIKLASQLS